MVTSGMVRRLVYSLGVCAALGSSTPVAAEVRVGVAAPLTGPNAAFGAQLLKGAQQAANDINRRGGIDGETITLVLADDVSDPKHGVSVANRFVADRVKFVIGHFSSSVSIPASEVYAENGIVMISPSSTHPKLTEQSFWNVFRLTGRDDQQGLVAGQYLASRFEGSKVAVVDDGTPYGHILADAARGALHRGRPGAVINETASSGQVDVLGLARKMTEQSVAAVYFGGSATDAGRLVRALRDQGSRTLVMSADGFASPELKSIAGGSLEGSLVTAMPDPRTNPGAREVVERFRASGFEPEDYTLYAYSAMQVFAQAIEKSGSTEAEAIAMVMKEAGPWETAIGKVGFDEKGDMTLAGFAIYEWQKGPAGILSPDRKVQDPNLCSRACPVGESCCGDGVCRTTCN